MSAELSHEPRRLCLLDPHQPNAKRRDTRAEVHVNRADTRPGCLRPRKSTQEQVSGPLGGQNGIGDTCCQGMLCPLAVWPPNTLKALSGFKVRCMCIYINIYTRIHISNQIYVFYFHSRTALARGGWAPPSHPQRKAESRPSRGLNLAFSSPFSAGPTPRRHEPPLPVHLPSAPTSNGAPCRQPSWRSFGGAWPWPPAWSIPEPLRYLGPRPPPGYKGTPAQATPAPPPPIRPAPAVPWTYSPRSPAEGSVRDGDL